MPVATVDPTSFEKKELTSAPPDGYVMVRPLPYGKKLERRDKATRMYMQANPTKSRKQAEEETQRFELETLNVWATTFDFAYCIGEHNLTDVNGVMLDLGSPMTMQILDPKIGDEIEKILADINGDDTDGELEDFIKEHTSVLPVETT